MTGPLSPCVTGLVWFGLVGFGCILYCLVSLPHLAFGSIWFCFTALATYCFVGLVSFV